MRRLADGQAVLVVIDGALLTEGAPEAAAMGRLVAAAKARGAEACMTLLGSAAAARIPTILDLGAVTNLLVHPMPVLAEELTITAHKLIHNDLFGAEKYLLWGTELHESLLVRGSQRADLAAQLAERVRGLGQRARVA